GQVVDDSQTLRVTKRRVDSGTLLRLHSSDNSESKSIEQHFQSPGSNRQSDGKRQGNDAHREARPDIGPKVARARAASSTPLIA
ncbi:MAG: hypothetical protein WD354_11160, partial [Acidimicrobiia bacterium]